MRPLSRDLRERIVAAYENGEGSHRALAERFAVSRAVVGKLVRQQRATGSLAPLVHNRGRTPAIRGDSEDRLRAHLESHPDATLQERIAAIGVDCSVKTMWLTLRRWGWRFKKSHRGRRSRTGRTWPANGSTGASAASASIPSDSCSSTSSG